jgi:hypothetical protein
VRLAKLLLLAAPLLAGCPNTDTAVFVDPSLDQASVTVSSSALGTSVRGDFQLSLHLGARASGPSQVSIGQFELMDAKKSAAIVTPLALDAGTVQFPVTVQPDSTAMVTLAFDTGTKLLAADVATKLCDPAGFLIVGKIEDSLQDTQTPVESAVLHATGCP